MSGYFERHRDVVTDRLHAVSSDDAWTAWRSFFLDGVADQAGENERKVRAILALLREAGLLHTVSAHRGRTGGVVAFTELIEIIEGRSPG